MPTHNWTALSRPHLTLNQLHPGSPITFSSPVVGNAYIYIYVLDARQRDIGGVDDPRRHAGDTHRV